MTTTKIYSSGKNDTPADNNKSNDVAERGFSLKERLLNVRTLVSFVLAFVIIYIVFHSIDIELRQTWQYMRQVNPWLYFLAFISFFITFPIRALRWRILLQNANFPIAEGRQSWASLPAMTEYIGLSWFANCVVPAKMGDAYRGYLLKRNGNVSFSGTMGTIVAERLLDMIMLFALLVLSGWSVFGTRLPQSTQFVFVFGLVLVIAIISALAAMRYLSPWLHRIIPTRFRHMYSLFEAGTLGSLKVRALPSLLLLTVLVWLGEAMRLFLVIEAMGGLRLGITSVIFIALMGSLLTTVPATPGGLGLVEGGITGVLQSSLFGVAGPIALAVALLDRVISYWCIVFFGFLLYLFSKRK